MKTAQFLAAALACIVSSTGAEARDLPSGGLTMAEFAYWLKAGGAPVQVQTNDGRASVVSAANGQAFHVYFFDCKQDRCGTIQFSAGFDTKGRFNAGTINDWNRDNRWARAYVDKANNPWLEYDVDLTPGGSFELLKDQLDIWTGALWNFRKFGGL